MNEPKPFVKWAGGKTKLIPYLMHFSPYKFNNYFEPFLGGGALFFKLASVKKFKKAYLNDSNPVLINAFKVIKKSPQKLIRELSSELYQNYSDIYYQIRAEEPEDEVKKAARFIYLNKTAFNGLYRVNSKGKFNVPYGRYKNPKILDKKNILAVSKALKKDEITCLDFELAIKKAKKYDFIYFDPPYQPISKTSNFTGYTANSFSKEDQERLRECFNRLDKKKCYVMLSNSYSPFIKDLYENYTHHIVMAGRVISCKGSGRGKIKELIITNYKTSTLDMLLSVR
jgi:DNA adenine methylase